MRDDQPTMPNLPPYAPGGAPMWPERGARAHGSGQRSMTPVLFGVSLGANVALLISVLGLFLLGRAGAFTPSAPTPPTAGGSTSLGSFSRPTATASPPPPSGWLQAAPSSVTLGCGDDQRHQFIVLINTGSQPVQWQATLSLPQDQAGVTVSPNQGRLNAGASMPLQLQSHVQGGGGAQQGVIRFTPSVAAAGPAPSVYYTAANCP